MANSSFNSEATITPQELAGRYAILSESQMQRLRQGERITLSGVELSAKIDRSHTTDSVRQRILLNVMAAESAAELDEKSFIEDGQQKIKWGDITDVNLATAEYTDWMSDDPLPPTYQGQSVTCTIELEEFTTSDGEEAEAFRVIGFAPESEKAGGNGVFSGNSPQDISADDDAEEDEPEHDDVTA